MPPTPPDATIVVLTGAGISKESGLDTFRDKDGIWSKVRLEREWAGRVVVVTQNIDDLHERAGSRDLIHMHGELLKIRCRHCNEPMEWRCDLEVSHACPDCGRTGCLRPHVVWFGEMPLEMERIFQLLQECALFVSIGTSGHVYPAAGFVDQVRRLGRAHTIELNLEPSEGASLFHEARAGRASDLVPAFVDELMHRHDA